jgi:TolA-binding protein
MGPTNRLFKLFTLAATLAVTVSTVASAQHGSGVPGVATFLSAVNSIGAEIKAFNAEKSITSNDIHLTSLQTLSNEGNAATLNKVIAKNSAQIATLRETLKTNAIVTAKLAAGGVSIDQVVAIAVDPGSEIHIFYQ